MGRSRTKKIKTVPENPHDLSGPSGARDLPPPLTGIGSQEKLPASFRRMVALQKYIEKKPKKKKLTELQVLKRRTDINIRDNETLEQFSRRVWRETSSELTKVDRRFRVYQKRGMKRREEREKEENENNESVDDDKNKQPNTQGNGQNQNNKKKKKKKKNSQQETQNQKGDQSKSDNAQTTENKPKKFSDFKDVVQFGEVAQAPPRFETLKKQIRKKEPKPTSSHNTPFKQQLREEAVAQYRELKKQKRQQQNSHPKPASSSRAKAGSDM